MMLPHSMGPPLVITCGITYRTDTGERGRDDEKKGQALENHIGRWDTNKAENDPSLAGMER
jgi:hypothetical protein